MIKSWHWVQHTPNTARTTYCINPKLHCLPLPASLSAPSGPCSTQFSTFPQLRVNEWIVSQLPLHMPPDQLPPDSLPPDSLPPDSLPADWLPPDWTHSDQLPPDQPPSDQLPPDQLPPSTTPILIDHGIQGYLLTRSNMASKCISEFTWSLHPSASRNSLNHSLQVHLWVYWISLSPSSSPNSLDPSLQLHLQTHSITASKCISEFTLSLGQQVHL